MKAKQTNGKRVTKATVKSFIKNNIDDMYINIKSTFSGYTDSLERCNKGFQKAELDTNEYDVKYSLGVKDAYFVGDSRDYFENYEDEKLGLTGYRVWNCCGCFILAVRNKTSETQNFLSNLTAKHSELAMARGL